jgi:cytoskeletal protein RodZ
MGEELRRARESKGLNLLQVEEVTKIRVKYLEALENEDFNVIPGKVYIKGFVKNYAAFLGLNVVPFIEYLNETTFNQAEIEEEKEFVVTNPQPKGQFGLKYVFAVIVVIAIGYVLMSNPTNQGNLSSAQNGILAQSETAEKKNGQPAVDSSDPTKNPKQTGSDLDKNASNVKEPTNTKLKTTPGTTSAPISVSSTPNAKVNIVLRAARQNSWALVKVDGKVKFQGFIKLNQQVAFNGQQAIYVKLGNAGAIDVYHNGKMLGTIGPMGQVSKQTFN